MELSNTALVNATSAAPAGSVQSSAAIFVLKQAMQSQSQGALELLKALPQPALATSGSLGTRLNAYA